MIYRFSQLPLRSRIAYIFSVAIVLFALLFSTITVSLLREQLLTDKLQKLDIAGTGIAAIIRQLVLEDEDGRVENHTDTLSSRIYEQHIPFYVLYTVYRTDGSETQVVATNDPFIPVCTDVSDTLQKRGIYYDKDFYTDGPIHIIYTTTHEDPYIIQTAMNMEQDSIIAVSQRTPLVIAIMIIPLLILTNAASHLLTKRITRSLKETINTANMISSTNLTQRLDESGPDDELLQMAKAFNRLFSRLETDFKRERQFTSDVSHELRTPLAVIQGHTEMLQRWGKSDPNQLETSLKAIQQEAKGMQNLTENLLLLSRSESGRIPVSLSFIKVTGLFENLEKEFAVTSAAVFTYTKSDDDIIYTDELILSQVLKILITNSIHYSPAPAHIELSFEYIAKGIADRASWRIAVTDHGNGIAAKDLPFVFQRLYRGDESRTKSPESKGSNGLGLAIAQSLSGNIHAELSAQSPIFQDESAPGTRMVIIGNVQIQDDYDYYALAIT